MCKTNEPGKDSRAGFHEDWNLFPPNLLSQRSNATYVLLEISRRGVFGQESTSGVRGKEETTRPLVTPNQIRSGQR